MHKSIQNKFPNAQYFGFTRTPRFNENPSADGRTTADIFQKLKHSYLIKDAIREGNVLGFNIDYVKTINYTFNETDDFATRLIESNADVKTVSVILDHSNIATTFNLYVHPNNEQKKKSIEKAFKYINNKYYQ